MPGKHPICGGTPSHPSKLFLHFLSNLKKMNFIDNLHLMALVSLDKLWTELEVRHG